VSVISTIWAPSTSACTPTSGPLTFSQPTHVDLRIYRGDTGRFRVQVTWPDGTPVNIAAATWDCDIRATVDDTAVTASLTVTPVDSFTVEVLLDAATSASLTGGVWDLEMTLNGAVTTLLAGDIIVTKDVSRT
jgi:hypothetical protein